MSLRPVAGITDERELTPEMVAARRAGAAARRVGAALVGSVASAAQLDEVAAALDAHAGRGGMTGTLHVRYRRPTPLHVPLRYEAHVTSTRPRTTEVHGELRHGDEVTAEAQAVFVLPRGATAP